MKFTSRIRCSRRTCNERIPHIEVSSFTRSDDTEWFRNGPFLNHLPIPFDALRSLFIRRIRHSPDEQQKSEDVTGLQQTNFHAPTDICRLDVERCEERVVRCVCVSFSFGCLDVEKIPANILCTHPHTHPLRSNHISGINFVRGKKKDR